MKLTLSRKKLGNHATMGELSVDGVFECFTLEDVVRKLGEHGEGKIMHETAIPAGEYLITLSFSHKFGKTLPRLLEVPFFSDILIHSGNTDLDTWGCILVGGELTGETIKRGTARSAFAALYAKLQRAFYGGQEVSIAITNDFPETLK